jgi:ABC-type Fe3+ transport system permease subunit
MNEKKLGKALLHGQDPTDVAALTQRVLARDQRRIWTLGILCVLVWMAVVMLPWATILPMMAKVGQMQFAIDNGTPLTPAQQHDQTMQMAEVLKQGTIATFLFSVGSMFVAAVCTISFIALSRRATLRQVNARLADLSAQLALLAGERK